jgi:hypothetical protein
MNYELAKQLKDAGFPQNTDNQVLHPFFCTGWDKGNKCTKKDQCTVPTLSELIEACGGEFLDLSTIEGKDYVWEACGKYYCCDEHGEGRKFGEGKTPEEAVAKLWLELNKKPLA